MKPDSPEYLSLAEGDKEALKYLVKAGDILENIHLQIDDHHNLPFKKFLESEVKRVISKRSLPKFYSMLKKVSMP